jgi:hypothetical protein
VCACLQTTVAVEGPHISAQRMPQFRVDFGKRVVGLDPLSLFNISGTERSDVVYDVDNGVLHITAFVTNPAAPVHIRCVGGRRLSVAVWGRIDEVVGDLRSEGSGERY